MSERIELRCACGREHALDVSPSAGDPRGSLVVLADGWGPVRGATLQRWARSGRLRAHTLERGKLAAWESEIRTAIEAEPYRAPEQRRKATTTEPGDVFAADSSLEAAE